MAKSYYFQCGESVIKLDRDPMRSDYVQISKAKFMELNEKQSKTRLKKLIKRGDNITTLIRNVSTSGMSREIIVLIARGKEVKNISYDVSQLLDWKRGNNEGVIVSGCGMDMAFHLVYSLGSMLFNDGYALKKVSL
jgi:hypothetical protein